jgi:hypothetical protein
MAEGRMLKRNVAISKRLPKLQSDSARMLWTWLLPFLDVEGRYYAAPDLIKANVVPRVKTFNEENISEYLDDMAEVGLITLYEVDNEAYLQFRKFDDFQTLRKSKEGKPLPPPPTHARTTPGQLPDNYCTTPDKVKGSKEKLSKEKLSKGPADAPFVLPSKEEIQESSDPKIEEHIQHVCDRLYEEKIFPDVNAFKNKMLKGKKNGRGVLHALARCYIAKPEDPWGYCQKIISIEDGNYNERDYRKTAQ